MHIDFISTIPVIAATGCLTRAAEVLDVSPATIHKRLKKVEAYYQVEIFVKSNRQLVLTDKGKQLLVGIEEIKKLNDTLIKNNTNECNTIKIGMNQGLALRLVKEIISPFLEQNKNCAIEIETITGQDSLAHFQGDFAITTIPINNPNFNNYVFDELVCYFVASLDYLEKHGEPQHLDDLYEHNLIVTPIDFIDGNTFFCLSASGEQQRFSFNSRITVDSKLISDAFVASGNGIGLTPHRTLVSNRPDNVKVLFNGKYYSKTYIQVCSNKQVKKSTLANDFMDLIIKNINHNYI